MEVSFNYILLIWYGEIMITLFSFIVMVIKESLKKIKKETCLSLVLIKWQFNCSIYFYICNTWGTNFSFFVFIFNIVSLKINLGFWYFWWKSWSFKRQFFVKFEQLVHAKYCNCRSPLWATIKNLLMWFAIFYSWMMEVHEQDLDFQAW